MPRTQYDRLSQQQLGFLLTIPILAASGKDRLHWHTSRPMTIIIRTSGERLRTICARLISAWRRQGGALWIDGHGINSWRRLCLHDMLRREREGEEMRSCVRGAWQTHENESTFQIRRRATSCTTTAQSSAQPTSQWNNSRKKLPIFPTPLSFGGALAPYVPFGILRWSQACWKLESWGYPPVKTPWW